MSKVDDIKTQRESQPISSTLLSSSLSILPFLFCFALAGGGGGRKLGDAHKVENARKKI